jgi:hypothetical protein
VRDSSAGISVAFGADKAERVDVPTDGVFDPVAQLLSPMWPWTF